MEHFIIRIPKESLGTTSCREDGFRFEAPFRNGIVGFHREEPRAEESSGYRCNDRAAEEPFKPLEGNRSNDETSFRSFPQLESSYDQQSEPRGAKQGSKQAYHRKREPQQLKDQHLPC